MRCVDGAMHNRSISSPHCPGFDHGSARPTRHVRFPAGILRANWGPPCREADLDGRCARRTTFPRGGSQGSTPLTLAPGGTHHHVTMVSKASQAMPERDDQLGCIVTDDRRSAAHPANCSCPSHSASRRSSRAGRSLEASNRGRIACLVLDVRMAGMSGVNVLRQLAAAGVAIPTIVRTVHGDETRSHRTGREGPRAPQSMAAPRGLPGW